MLINVLIPIRVGSQRLPFKHLAKLNGIPIYEIIYKNALALFPKEAICFCIPNTMENDFYSHKLSELGANVFRGDEMNVLLRLQDAALKTESKYIARLCGDNVFIIKDLIEEIILFSYKILALPLAIILFF